MSAVATELVSDVQRDDENAINVSPFEGPEKLLEIWFAPSAHDVVSPDDTTDANGIYRSGLRRVPREVWEEMLDIVKCSVLSVIHGEEMDAYLLRLVISPITPSLITPTPIRSRSYSESSLFIAPHKLILKTCGTTLNLLGLPRILEIAASDPAQLPSVHRLFYSRKSFMFPERQQGPHREWTQEVSFLDKLFGLGHEKASRGAGAAYTVGSVNRDHWLLYLTSPTDEGEPSSDSEDQPTGTETPNGLPLLPDFTLEILMSKLAAPGRRHFFYPDGSSPDDRSIDLEKSPHHALGQAMSSKCGITDLFPISQTTLDAFAFEPCGYSANAFVRHEDGEGYYTIHVTPEEGWSYASFECNIPLPTSGKPSEIHEGDQAGLPDLGTLIQRVVNIFQPGHLAITLFVSSSMEDSPIETAQKIFYKALTAKDKGFGYKRVDKINYEFGGYDLAFATYERRAIAHQPDWSIEVEQTKPS
ncbi:spermidine resistance protein [Tulasnella sp. 403]|nr:spermidine resistance protein [Tulasnella sp. 403]